jgi:uncharacterized integral membrane protein
MRRDEPNRPEENPDPADQISPGQANLTGQDSEASADAAQVRADQEHLRALQKERQARVAKAIVALALVAILIIFITSNSKPASVSFVFFHRRPPLIWVMFACAVLGGVVGFLIGRPGKQIRVRRRPKEQQKP